MRNVGDEVSFVAYEVEGTDSCGMLIMPSIADGHVCVTVGVLFAYADMGVSFELDGWQVTLDFMVAYIKDSPRHRPL